MENKGELQIFVDAGYREKASVAPNQIRGAAGLGVWIPALGTGVALSAEAADNNESETLAILLGVAVAEMMGLSPTRVLTDSRASFERLTKGGLLSSILGIVQRALCGGSVQLEWRSREATSLADFFASLALEGKCLVATASNGKNPADKFRPLLHLERQDKIPLKEVTLKWLTLPSMPKVLPKYEAVEGGRVLHEMEGLLGHEIPRAEFHVLVEHFRGRAKKTRKVSSAGV